MENKQKFIAQIMSSKSPVRSCQDVDETALTYAEIKALCAGNPLIAEKMNLDIEVAKLRMLKADHQSQHYRLEDDLLKRYPEQITSVTERIAGIEKDIATYAVHSEKTMQLQEGLNGAVSATAVFAGMTIIGEMHTEKEPAAKALLELCKGITDKKEQAIGEYMGFKMSLRLESSSFDKKFNLLLRGNMTYQLELGADAFGNISRINNLLHELPKRLQGAKEQLESLLSQQEAAKQELQKPFALTDELAEKEARLALLNADLNIDGGGGLDVTNDPDNRTETEGDIEPDDDEDYEYEYEEEYTSQAAYAKSARPPMLETIRSYNADKQPPVPGKKTTERDI